MVEDRDGVDTDEDGEMPEQPDAVPLTDWNRIAAELRTLDGTVTETGDRIELRAGSATFAVTRDGRVEAGMPLHDLNTGSVTGLAVDHGRGAIRLVTDDGDVEYEFRVP
jgi:hypothetical protein